MSDPEFLQLCCPHCEAQNRIPRARQREHPRCGRCHNELFAGRPLLLTARNFEEHGARSDVPLVVDFWAPWCGPCLAMAPAFESAAQVMEPALRFGKVDTEQEPGLAAKFSIRSIPTLVMLHRGREIARQSGAVSGAALMNWIRGTLPSS